ncbi:MAG: T9SS type A sorting domain-containing protein [Flavobacteriales bacterium]|nr:T9SS type A sorting domain-containing protein [Flavobacteriales bacterium]
MHLRYSFALGTLLTLSAAHAQGVVTLTNEDGEVVNGTVIVAPCDWSTDTVSLYSMLTGSSAATVNVRRYEIWPVPGTVNFFCWGVCYLPAAVGTHPTWVSQDHVSMSPGVNYNNFHAYHQAQGNTATMRYKFVWYDVANPNGPDSSWVDIDFCGLVGVPEAGSLNAGLTVWPSPTQGMDVQMEYQLGRGGNAQVVLYNVLGEAMRRSNVGAAQGRIQWSTADLAPGVYFAALERAGQPLATRRFVVTR